MRCRRFEKVAERPLLYPSSASPRGLSQLIDLMDCKIPFKKAAEPPGSGPTPLPIGSAGEAVPGLPQSPPDRTPGNRRKTHTARAGLVPGETPPCTDSYCGRRIPEVRKPGFRAGFLP